MENKIEFLQSAFIEKLREIDAATKPVWGKMNLQQMIEHFYGDAVKCASGKLKMEKVLTPPDHLEKMRGFLMSEKPFKENTKNILMGEEPLPVRNITIEAAIEKLKFELDYFFEVFRQNPQLITRNPFFGDLNFEQNVQLLHKHALHHLRQFGVVV